MLVGLMEWVLLEIKRKRKRRMKGDQVNELRCSTCLLPMVKLRRRCGVFVACLWCSCGVWRVPRCLVGVVGARMWEVGRKG